MDGDTDPKEPEETQSSKAKTDEQLAPQDDKASDATTASDNTPQTLSNGPAANDWAHMYDAEIKPVEVKPISWSGPEFINHDKDASWYFVLGGIAIAIAALVYVLTKDKISTAAIIVVAGVLGFAAARKPRTLPYTLDSESLTINAKVYPFVQFRSFAVFDDGTFSSIIFMPLKRFMPLIEVYYDRKDEEQIVALLADRLPMETHSLDPVEQFMRRIHF